MGERGKQKWRMRINLSESTGSRTGILAALKASNATLGTN